MSIKIIIGIAIIAASFVYILKRPGRSLMDSLMEKRNEDMQKALMQTQDTGSENTGTDTEAADADRTDASNRE